MKISKKLFVKIRKIGRRIFKNSTKQNLVQEKAFSVIRKLILKQNSTLLVAPISGTCYIENKEYFVKFNSTYATITNSKFSYYIEFDFKHGEKLVYFFNRSVEEKRKKLEDKYNIKTVKNLEQLINSI